MIILQDAMNDDDQNKDAGKNDEHFNQGESFLILHGLSPLVGWVSGFFDHARIPTNMNAAVR